MSEKAPIINMMVENVIIHMYCVVVQASFYRDMVKCLTLDQRVPSSILSWGMNFLFFFSFIKSL